MTIKRVTCEKCGLAATKIQMGDRVVTSFDPEQCALRCAIGKAARVAGEPIAARVLECEHMSAALKR